MTWCIRPGFNNFYNVCIIIILIFHELRRSPHPCCMVSHCLHTLVVHNYTDINIALSWWFLKLIDLYRLACSYLISFLHLDCQKHVPRTILLYDYLNLTLNNSFFGQFPQLWFSSVWKNLSKNHFLFFFLSSAFKWKYQLSHVSRLNSITLCISLVLIHESVPTSKLLCVWHIFS